MACQQACTGPIRLANLEAASAATEDFSANELPSIGASDSRPTGNPSDNAENSAERRQLFVRPPEHGKRPYFSNHSCFSDFRNLYVWSGSSKLLDNRIYVHKQNAAGIEVNLVQDIWALEKDEQSDLFIFVEDLDPNVIETIGSSLQIPATVFKQHLGNSSYLMDAFGWSIRSEADRYRANLENVLRCAPFQNVSQSCVSLQWFSVASLSPVFRLYLERAQDSSRWEYSHSRGQVRWNVNGHAQTLTPSNNIFRQQNILFEGPGRTGFGSLYACKEQATITIRMRGVSRDVLVFTDPLPTVKHCGTREPRNPTTEVDLESNWEETVKSAFEWRLSSRSPNRSESSKENSVLDDPQYSERIEARSFYQDVSARLQVCKAQGVEALPLDATLETVRTDTSVLIAFIDVVIGQVYGTLQARNGHKVFREEAETWRRVCFWAEHEFPNISASITETLQYFKDFDAQVEQPQNRHALLSPSMEDKMNTLVQRIRDTGERVKSTQEAINSEMALINSKRGIAEAENVKRLTELAFVFIPMTFVAGVFSIQVEEFQVSPPRAWVFVVTSVSLIAFVYAIRLLRYLAIQGRWGQKMEIRVLKAARALSVFSARDALQRGYVAVEFDPFYPLRRVRQAILCGEGRT